MNNSNSYIIVFDGVCVLCNTFAQFLIKNDKKNIFKFTSIESKSGKKIIDELTIDVKKTDSIILIKNKKVYYKSSAVLHILKFIRPYYLFYPLILIPNYLRDFIYDVIAKNRYKWFGKQKYCKISGDFNHKFI